MKFTDISWSILVVLFWSGSGDVAKATGNPACAGAGLLSDFSQSNKKAGFAASQLQNGSFDRVADPSNTTNSVAKLTAGPKRKRVGKAALIHRFSPVGIGQTIDMSARFFVPKGNATNSIILMDLECASCGLDTNPGIRLYLREGRLRVDRSKVGVKEPFYPSVDHRVQTEQWHEVRWLVTLGDQNAGRSQVFLNGQQVGNNTGTTIITQRIVSQLADLKVREQVDRFQVGLTANSNRSSTDLLVDDVRFCSN